MIFLTMFTNGPPDATNRPPGRRRRYPRSMPVPESWVSKSEDNRSETENSDRELSEFLLRLAHDLRSPLRAVRANAESIRKELRTPGDGVLDPRIGFILGGAQSLDLLADGLSSYALALRIDPAAFQPVQLDVLLRLALARLRDELRDSGGEVTYDAMPRVLGNPDRLVQLFDNLVLNALRHRGPAAPRIQISAERQAADWRIAVRDNGPGIEAAFLERIFAPFERLCGKELPGPGLGLTVSRAIVRRHGGAIWADSELGAGSTFSFTLPPS